MTIWRFKSLSSSTTRSRNGRSPVETKLSSAPLLHRTQSAADGVDKNLHDSPIKPQKTDFIHEIVARATQFRADGLALRSARRDLHRGEWLRELVMRDL